MVQPRRILIIKPSSLGDVATTLPIAVDLKAAFPEAQIDWLIHPGLRALVDHHPALHEAIDFDRKGLGAWWYKPSALGKLWKLIKRLRAAKYDCVIDAQGLLRSGLFTFLSAAPMRIGFANAREGATLFYTHKVPMLPIPRRGEGTQGTQVQGPNGQISTVRMRALLKPLGMDTADRLEARADIPIDAEALNHIQNLITGLQITQGNIHQNIAVVIPGARWDTKRWRQDHFITIVHRLLGLKMPVVIAGSKDEAPLCQTIFSATQAKGKNNLLCLAGQTNLKEMTALLAVARIIIGNDSGPLHVAAALGVPLVGIYGPTDPNYVGPFGQMPHVVRHDVECHPCRNKTCDHHSCMQKLDVEAVWEKISQVLAEPYQIPTIIPVKETP